MRNILKRVFMGGVLAASVTGCFGPRPTIREKSFTRSPESPGYYEARAVVENLSSGEGEAKIRAWLTDEKTHLTYKQEKNIDLQAHEKSVVMILIRAPEASYSLQVEAEYPPR